MERKRGNFLLVKKLAERETNELLSKILGKDKEKYVLNENSILDTGLIETGQLIYGN